MNSYIPYSPNAKAAAGASTKIVHTENVYSVGSVNNTYIDLTAADVLKAFSNNEVIYIIDRESTANSSTVISLMTLERFNTTDNTGQYNVTFVNGSSQWRFKSSDLYERLVLSQRA